MRPSHNTTMHSLCLILAFLFILIVPMGCNCEKDSDQSKGQSSTDDDDDTGQAATARLYITSDADSCKAGQNLDIQVKIEKVENLFGAAFDVDFPADFEFVSGEALEFLKESGSNPNFMATLENDTTGKLVVGVSKIGKASPATGNGGLAKLTFKCKNDQSSPFGFSLSNNRLMDENLADIAIDEIQGL